MRFFFLTPLVFITVLCFGQEFSEGDSLVSFEEKGWRYSLKINKLPCDYDTSKTCISFDTLSRVRTIPIDIFYYADSIALSLNIPPKLVYEIGMNESRWLNPQDLNFLIKDGDLQVIDRTFNVMYKRLALTGGKTRYNYLVVGINYLNDCYKVGGSWRKARYIYGRGRWKEPSQWTKLERHFMNKIDWTQYD